MEADTRTLVARARAADRTAVDELFRRYREPLRRALGKLLGSRYRALVADSEDAAHDAILQSLGRIEEFEYRGRGSFLAWLCRRAEREVIDSMRKLDTKKRGRGQAVRLDEEGSPEPQAMGPSASHAASADEMRARVRDALDRLPDNEREVIVLRRFMELPMEEIRDELGLATTGAVRALLSRAQVRLSGVLAREGIDGTELES